MSKWTNDIKDTLTQVVVHTVSTSRSKKSSVNLVAVNVQTIPKVIITQVSR